MASLSERFVAARYQPCDREPQELILVAPRDGCIEDNHLKTCAHELRPRHLDALANAVIDAAELVATDDAHYQIPTEVVKAYLALNAALTELEAAQ